MKHQKRPCCRPVLKGQFCSVVTTALVASKSCACLVTQHACYMRRSMTRSLSNSSGRSRGSPWLWLTLKEMCRQRTSNIRYSRVLLKSRSSSTKECILSTYATTTISIVSFAIRLWYVQHSQLSPDRLVLHTHALLAASCTCCSGQTRSMLDARHITLAFCITGKQSASLAQARHPYSDEVPIGVHEV